MESPTFGMVIRGLRLGYHWSHNHQCFVRIDAQGPPWEIRLAPHGVLPSGKYGTGKHRCWWDEGEDVLAMIIPLKGVKGIKKPIMFFVDDEGARA